QRDRRADPLLRMHLAEGAMNRKTLRDFAELHAPAAMRRWRDAHAECVLRAMCDGSGFSAFDGENPTDRADPASTAAAAEIEIEAALVDRLESGRYAIEGRRNGKRERFQYVARRMRLNLATDGVREVDDGGRFIDDGTWTGCDVIDEGTSLNDAQSAPEAT